jgi:tripartite-type tricarboxylate transporter receptor subunit TctC
VNNYLMYDVPYDPFRDFDYISGVAELAGSLIVKADAPWKTWNEFVDYSKKHPNEIRMGLSGTGGVVTVAAKWIAKELGIKWREVTFPGEAEGMLALLGGNVDAFPGPSAHNRLIEDGRARPLLSLTNRPIPAYAQVPTFKQLYGKDPSNANGLMAPKGIPEAIRKKIDHAVREATKGPEFLEMMKKMNMTPQYGNSEEFTQDVKNAITSFKELLDALGMLKKKK